MNHLVSSTRSLYIHWPFCPYKCNFCPFVAIAGHDQFMERYHAALKQELIAWATTSTKKFELDTIFMGGGTPSTYPTNLLLDMFDTLNKVCVISPNAEISIEVNPGTVKQEQLDVWKTCGINRLSIGVQGLKDTVLHSLNRLQSAQDVRDVMSMARVSFDNLSVDLILGLPGITEEEWKATLAEVITWPIKHISIYFLTVHENTPLYFRVVQKQVALTDDEEMVALYHWTVAYLQDAGFDRYELSNFARRGYECRHNIGYWNRLKYKGIGLGACSFDGVLRYQNEKNLMKYMTVLESNGNPVVIEEFISEDQVRMETMMLHLRTRDGLARSYIFEGLCKEDYAHYESVVEELEMAGMLESHGAHVRLSSQGLVVENEVLVKLMRK